MSTLRVDQIESLNGEGQGLFTYDYRAGLVLESLGVVVRSGGIDYTLDPSTPLPYTTTGAGMPEGGAFKVVGDPTVNSRIDDLEDQFGVVVRTSSELEAALNSSGIYQVTEGAYTLNGTYTPTGPLSITFRQGASVESSSEVLIDTSDDLTIKGGSFDFSGQPTPGPFTALGLTGDLSAKVRVEGLSLSNSQRSMLEVIGFGEAVVRDNRVANTGLENYNSGASNIGAGIIVRDCSEVDVSENWVSNTFASSIFIWGTTADSVISARAIGNYIRLSSGNGLRFQSDDAQRQGVANAVATGNVIEFCDSHGIRTNLRRASVTGNTILACNIGIVGEVGTQQTISSNTIVNCTTAGILYNIRYGISGTGAEDLLITSNTVTGVQSGNSIGVLSLSSDQIRNVSIVGNHISIPSGNTVNGIAVNGGAGSTGLRVAIQGNVLTGVSNNAAEVDNAVYASISNNTVSELASGSAAYFVSNAARTVVTGNSCYNQDSSYVARPLVIRSGVAYSSVISNSFETTANGFISYQNSPGTSRYEVGNVTANSDTLQQYSLTGVSSNRTADLSTATTSELGEVVYAIVQDLAGTRSVGV